MKTLLPFGMAIAICTAITACGEEYTNSPYGLSIRTHRDWKFLSTAKLEVDLHELSDEQLSELFRAYEPMGVVRLAKGDGRSFPIVAVHFVTPRAQMVSALEMAELCESGAISQKGEILVSATERDLGGVPAAYLATKNEGRAVQMQQFFVKRARTYVVVTCMLPYAPTAEQMNDVAEMVANIKIDVDSDSRDVK